MLAPYYRYRSGNRLIQRNMAASVKNGRRGWRIASFLICSLRGEAERSSPSVSLLKIQFCPFVVLPSAAASAAAAATCTHFRDDGTYPIVKTKRASATTAFRRAQFFRTFSSSVFGQRSPSSSSSSNSSFAAGRYACTSI